jgi:nucleotide-binding universal stress UspA family protein
MLLGSVSEYRACHATCPVVSVHATNGTPTAE